MKKTIIFLTLLVFIFILAACQKDSTVADIPVMTYHNIEVVDGIGEFKKALTENKIIFTAEEAKEQSDIIPGKRVFIHINNERVTVHQFPSTGEAKDFTDKFDIGGCAINSTMVSWAGYPHFFYKWNLIVQYVGNSDEVVKTLEGILGNEFSGYYAVGNKSHPKVK